jgi:hypothetical protein
LPLEWQCIRKKDIYAKLVESKPIHASPFEHQAYPIKYPEKAEDWKQVPGITHVDKADNYWSNNFKGWVQYRSLLSV